MEPSFGTGRRSTHERRVTLWKCDNRVLVYPVTSVFLPPNRLLYLARRGVYSLEGNSGTSLGPSYDLG